MTVAFIWHNYTLKIGECRAGLFKINTVLGEIRNFLRLVPFKMFAEIFQADLF